MTRADVAIRSTEQNYENLKESFVYYAEVQLATLEQSPDKK